ncbi:MAG: alcohol dehydrogenase catalytic domain-containing protein [Stappiaceae bacterium]
MMRALRFHARRDLRLDQVSPPSSPKGDDVILEVTYCGICGTDLHEYLHGPIIVPQEPHPVSGAQMPLILGHEFSAQVAAIGPEVRGLQLGDRVAVLPHLMAKGDWYDRRNLGQFSPQTGLVGLTWHWGGMGEQVLVPAENVVPLPDGVSDIQGTMIEPAAVALNALDETGLKAGDTVLITGAGPIGALVAMAARTAGAARIYLHDPNKGRIARLSAMEGITTFDGASSDVLEQIVQDTDQGVGVDIAIECAGHPDALALCLDGVRRKGNVAIVGLIGGQTPVDLFKVCEKGLNLIGTWGNDFTIGPRLIALIETGRFPVEELVTSVVPLETAIAQGFDVLARPGSDELKIMIDMQSAGDP